MDRYYIARNPNKEIVQKKRFGIKVLLLLYNDSSLVCTEETVLEEDQDLSFSYQGMELVFNKVVVIFPDKVTQDKSFSLPPYTLIPNTVLNFKIQGLDWKTIKEFYNKGAVGDIHLADDGTGKFELNVNEATDYLRHSLNRALGLYGTDAI